jgi:tetratricopeptide (TPR) repeat protein
VIARDRGDAERTTRLCQESLQLFRSAGDQHGAAITLISLGMAAGQQEEVERALSHYQESLALFRAAGDNWHTAWVLIYQAHLMVRFGHFAAARRSAEEGLALHRMTNDPWGVAMALSALGRVAQADGDLGTAVAHFVEGLRLLIESGVTRAMPGLLEDLAGVALVWGQPNRAARLGGAGEALREAAGVLPRPGDWTAGTIDLSDLRTGPQAGAWMEGRMLPIDAVLTESNVFAEAITRSRLASPSEPTLVVERSLSE